MSRSISESPLDSAITRVDCCLAYQGSLWPSTYAEQIPNAEAIDHNATW